MVEVLSTQVSIQSPSQISGNRYTANLVFLDSVMAQFINLGDVVRDSANNEYSVIEPTTLPFSSGGLAVLSPIMQSVIPVGDSGWNFDGSIYTPNQVDVRPIRTTGEIQDVSPFYGPNHEYTISAYWLDPIQESKCTVGDRIVDSNGKEFQITWIDPDNRFSVPFVAKEVEREGVMPSFGTCTMYHPTSVYNFFQGTADIPLSALLNILNRDSFVVDRKSQRGDFQQIYHTLTAGEITSKSLTITPTPIVPLEVVVEILGGVALTASPTQNGTGDYYISPLGVFSWSDLGLDGVLSEDEELRFTYFS